MTDAYERPPVQAYRNPAPVSAGMRLIWENWDARGLRMCMEAAEMYGGAAWVWGAYGDRKLIKTKVCVHVVPNYVHLKVNFSQAVDLNMMRIPNSV